VHVEQVNNAKDLLFPNSNLSNLPQFLNLSQFYISLVNDSGRSYFKLEFFAAHGFNENSQMELATSRNSITIGRVSFGHVQGNVAFQFFKEAIMHHGTSQETTTVEISQREFTDGSNCELKRVRNHSRCSLVNAQAEI
jgi:hypothetical protein